MVAQTEIDIDAALRANTIFLLKTHWQDLEENDYSRSEIYQELQQRNSEQPYSLSDEEFARFASDLLTPQEQARQENARRDMASELKRIIADKDVTALYTKDVINYLATIKKLSSVSYALTESQIKESFGKLLNKSSFNQAVSETVRLQVLSETGEKKSVADIAYQWACEHLDLWAFDEQYQTWRMFNGDYWEVQADKGSFLDRYAVAAIQEAKIAVNSPGVLTLFQRVAAGHCVRAFIHPCNKVNFANGTLNTDTMQLATTHDKDDNFTYCLPYSYNPHGTCTAIMDFLRSIIGELRDGQFITNEHGVQAFMAHVGLALMGDTNLQKAIIALGIPGSGKSTLLDLVNLMCGLKAKQYVPYDVFSRELEGKRSRFAHNQKRVACIDEVPADAFEDEETVKQMIAHSGVPMRGLHKEEKDDNQWRPKLFLVANDDPHYKDISGAIKRRLLIVRCPIQRYDEPRDGQPGQDPLLLSKLSSELGSFAAWCIGLAVMVCERGYYPQSATMKRDLDQLAISGNPLKACLAEKFILEQSAHTLTSELYAAYLQFYEGEVGKNGKALGSPKFASALCGMGKGISAKKLNRQRALAGIRLRDESEAIPQEETYEGSALLVDMGRLNEKWDGWDGCGTAEKASCHTHRTASQADLGGTGTVGTANSQISAIKNTITHDSDTSVIYVKETSNLAVPTVPHGKNEPVEPFNKCDGTNNQPSPAVPVPDLLLPELVERYPSDVYAYHDHYNKKIKKATCLRNHNNVQYLPWFSVSTATWIDSCTQCYPNLRASKGVDSEPSKTNRQS